MHPILQLWNGINQYGQSVTWCCKVLEHLKPDLYLPRVKNWMCVYVVIITCFSQIDSHYTYVATLATYFKTKYTCIHMYLWTRKRAVRHESLFWSLIIMYKILWIRANYTKIFADYTSCSPSFSQCVQYVKHNVM